MTIAVACLATAMLMLDISVVNTALSDIADGLDAGFTGLQWVVDAYTIPLAATVLTAGAIGIGLAAGGSSSEGLVAFTAMSALCGAAGGIEMLVGARADPGPRRVAHVRDGARPDLSKPRPTPEDRVKALAVYGAAIGASFALGPFIGGSLTELLRLARDLPDQRADRRGPALWVTWRFVGESRDPAPGGSTCLGQLTLIGGMFLLVLALLRGNEEGWGSTGIVAALAGAAVLLIAFIVIEERLARADAAAAADAPAQVRRRAGRRLCDRGVVLRRVLLPDALFAVRPRHVAHRDGPRISPGDVSRLRRLGVTAQLGAKRLARRSSRASAWCWWAPGWRGCSWSRWTPSGRCCSRGSW